jgi:hypothetical protein
MPLHVISVSRNAIDSWIILGRAIFDNIMLGFNSQMPALVKVKVMFAFVINSS